MAQLAAKTPLRVEMSGIERLALRVSGMINHPIAQAQRRVKIHRLDADGDREWEEVIGILSATDELDLIFEDDGAVTVRWGPITVEDRSAEGAHESEDELTPF
ncbi:DUF1654 domain-containing protein [Pseudomonas syringae]|uniref:DUF1654 domain-containing protein n=1 Tax=Pseudomonas syringae TaxID=317 RepID=UPI0032D8FDB3